MQKRDLVSAKRIAFQLLKFRNRSRQEIRDRLKKKCFPEEVIIQTIDFLEQLKYLDDSEFALSWSQARLAKPLGLRRIFFELGQKGIDKQIIDKTLQKLKQGYHESEIVEKIVKEKIKRMKSLDEYKAKNRIYGYLIRRGFNPDTIKEVIENL